MAASVLKDHRAREAVLAWAEARGWQAGWQEQSTLYRELPGTTDGLTGYALWAPTLWAWRRLVQLRGPAARRDRYVKHPPWLVDAPTPVLDDAVRSRLHSRLEEAGRARRFRPAQPIVPETLMAVVWTRDLGGAGPWRIVVVAADRFLAVFDHDRTATWVMAVPRTDSGGAWAVAADPEDVWWPFATNAAWTGDHAGARWFGPVPGGVRRMVAASAPRTAVLASPTTLTVLGVRPSKHLVPVDGFEQWHAFSSEIMSHVEGLILR